MKSLAQINGVLRDFEKKYGMLVVGAQQGSTTWMQIKLGVLSASNAHKIVAKRDTETRATYMCELAAQVCTGIFPEVSSEAMEWGHHNEDAARSAYEFTTDDIMDQLPFVFKDENYREGASPDGLLGEKKGAEIKCPFQTANYIKFLTEDFVKSEWKWQCQYILRVMEADCWDFVQFDPRMKKHPLKVITIGRDEEKQKAFDDLVPQFLYDYDNILARIGIKFGEQWERLREVK